MRSLEIDNRYQAILQNLPLALTLASMREPDCPLIAVNDAFLNLCGFSQNYVIGRNCRFLQNGLDNAESNAEITRAIAMCEPVNVVVQNRRLNGKIFWNYLTLVPISAYSDSDPEFYLGAQLEIDGPVDAQAVKDMTSARWDGNPILPADQHDRFEMERRRISMNAAVRLIRSHLLISTL